MFVVPAMDNQSLATHIHTPTFTYIIIYYNTLNIIEKWKLIFVPEHSSANNLNSNK